MQNIPLVDLKSQYQSIKGEIDSAIENIIANTRFIGGAELDAFEADFAKFQGTNYSVGVASGTGAIFLALRALGIREGDEIITTAHSFIATIEPVEEIGAIPVFVDIDPETYNIDVAKIEAAITDKTRAILPVHLYGQLAQMDVIMDIAKRHNLFVIEDAAQAHGAEYNGKRAGEWGDIATFSFYPGKNLGAYGDGGAICTNDKGIAECITQLRDHGRVGKYLHGMIGYGERLDTLQAAILHAKLPHLDEWNAKRREHATYYTERLGEHDKIVTPFIAYDSLPVFHIYCIRVQGDRDAILKELQARGVGAGIHYPIPIHLQPAMEHHNIGENAFPHTETIAKEIISLPIYAELTEEQRAYVVDTLLDILD